MKMIVCSLLLSSSTLFTMERQIESELKEMGIKISSMVVSPSELGHIRFHRTKESVNYLANCTDGMIMATFSHKHDKISCKKKIFCLSDGVEGVYQGYSERDMDAAHYHLLRILYDAQEEKKLLEKISNIARK